MAYDPNDPKDVAIVTAAVDAAIEEANESHELAIEGLKKKNGDLLAKLAKARAGGGDDSTQEINRLESELEGNQTKLRETEAALRTAKRDLVTVTGERDTARTSFETEATYARDSVIEKDLTNALTEAKVAPQFMDAAKALLSKGVVVKVEGDTRTAVVGDKPLGEHVKEWALSDHGKHYVAAANNNGSNTGDNKPAQGGGSKKVSEMTYAERVAHLASVGQVEFERQVTVERDAPKA